MSELNQDLIERRANCQIWFHLLLWFFVPFGWAISVFKMRYSLPAYAMLAAMGMSAISLPPCSSCTTTKTLQKAYEHGQGYGIAASILGSALTVREILESRRKNKSLVNSTNSRTGSTEEL
jgi:hypothetical protein